MRNRRYVPTFRVVEGPMILHNSPAASWNTPAQAECNVLVLAGSNSPSAMRTTFDSRDTGFRLYGGFRMTPYLSVEGGYVGLGRIGVRRSVDRECVVAQPVCISRTVTQYGNLRAGGWTLGLVGEIPIGHSFALSARAGLIRSTVRISNKVSEWGFSAEPATATQTRPIVGIGARALRRTPSRIVADALALDADARVNNFQEDQCASPLGVASRSHTIDL